MFLIFKTTFETAVPPYIRVITVNIRLVLLYGSTSNIFAFRRATISTPSTVVGISVKLLTTANSDKLDAVKKLKSRLKI